MSKLDQILDYHQDGMTPRVSFKIPQIWGEDTCNLAGGFLSKLIDEGCPRMVISLAGVEDVDSAFLGKLININNRLGRENLVLCDINEDIMEVLSITRLDKLFQIQPAAPVAQVAP